MIEALIFLPVLICGFFMEHYIISGLGILFLMIMLAYFGPKSTLRGSIFSLVLSIIIAVAIPIVITSLSVQFLFPNKPGDGSGDIIGFLILPMSLLLSFGIIVFSIGVFVFKLLLRR